MFESETSNPPIPRECPIRANCSRIKHLEEIKTLPLTEQRTVFLSLCESFNANIDAINVCKNSNSARCALDDDIIWAIARRMDLLLDWINVSKSGN
jgi:hypothetical protein